MNYNNSFSLPLSCLPLLAENNPYCEPLAWLDLYARSDEYGFVEINKANLIKRWKWSKGRVSRFLERLEEIEAILWPYKIQQIVNEYGVLLTIEGIHKSNLVQLTTDFPAIYYGS